MSANVFYMHPRRESGGFGLNVQKIGKGPALALTIIADGVAVSVFFESQASLSEHLERIRELAIIERIQPQPDLVEVDKPGPVYLGPPVG